MRKNLQLMLVIFGLFGISNAEKIFSGTSFAEDKTAGKRKNVTVAVCLSVLLPGAGETYLGARSSAVPFFVAEGAIWSAFAYNAYNDKFTSDQYKAFASKYAGVNTHNKDDEFFKTVSLYESRDFYNYSILVTTENRDALIPATDEWDWRWRDTEKQLQFYDMRTSAEKYERNTKIALGIAAIDRLISVINVLRLSRGGAGWTITASPDYLGTPELGFKVSVEGSFSTSGDDK